MPLRNINNLEAAKIIDHAAMEDRLYHFNGGQAYIRLAHPELDILMVIDLSITDKVTFEICEGSAYFKEYANYNKEYSARTRLRPLAPHYEALIESI